MKRRSLNLNQPLGRKGARRRVRTRTALLLCAASTAGTLLAGLLGLFAPPGVRVWLSGLASLLFFAVPAYLGLCDMDGGQPSVLPLRRLSGAQALWLAASGALLVCPATLLSDVMAALIMRFAAAFGAQVSTAASGSGAVSLFLPMLLVSGVIAPVCEEAFFRGYLQRAFSRYGASRAAVMTALLFAAAHGLHAGFAIYALLGLALSACVMRTGSVLASVIVHMAYNVTIVVLSATPLSMLFTGLTPAGCLARLLGCAGLCYTAKRVWLARGAREGNREALALTRREMALAIAALALVLLAQATAVWAAGGNA